MKQPLTTLIAGESGSFELEAQLTASENTQATGAMGPGSGGAAGHLYRRSGSKWNCIYRQGPSG
jgi:hypothetical protein